MIITANGNLWSILIETVDGRVSDIFCMKKLEKIDCLNKFSNKNEPKSSQLKTFKTSRRFSGMSADTKTSRSRSEDHLGFPSVKVNGTTTMFLKEKSEDGKNGNYEEIIQENRDLLKSLKQIERDEAFLTPVKNKDDKNIEENNNNISNYKRASKTKKTLQVVMDKFKRSPSILFTGPMENIYFLEVIIIFVFFIKF